MNNKKFDRADKPTAPSIIFLVRALEYGGAERQLVNLATGLHNSGWIVKVACFYADGPLQSELESAKIPIIDLQKRGRWDIFRFLWRLRIMINSERPHIVHSYLRGPNLIALTLRLFKPGTRIVWGIRYSVLDLSDHDWLERTSYRLERQLARFSDLIILNSFAGLASHRRRKFPVKKMIVIQNGVDYQRFRFDSSKRDQLRQEWKLRDKTRLVALIGRLVPVKDHHTFLQAAAALIESSELWKFVCVGSGDRLYTRELQETAIDLGIENHVIWAGSFDDMIAVHSASDIVVCSSSAEGFPNVVAEAMACGRPCVVTDVGDCAEIVGRYGEVVEPGNPLALASGVSRCWSRWIVEPTDSRDMMSRSIADRYGIDRLIGQTSATLELLIQT